MKKFFKKLFENHFVTGLGSFSLIFGIGYGIADYKVSLECQFEKNALQQEYNEKIASKINDCQKMNLDELKKPVEELSELVKQLDSKKLNSK